jgi:hypothetical protein
VSPILHLHHVVPAKNGVVGPDDKGAIDTGAFFTGLVKPCGAASGEENGRFLWTEVADFSDY